MCQRLLVNANGDICSTICWLIISSWGWNKPSCQRICSVMVYKLYLSMKYWQFLNNVILIKQTYISDLGHFSWCWQLCWGVLGFILLTTFELFGFSILCLMKVIQKLIVRTKLHIYVFCEPVWVPLFDTAYQQSFVIFACCYCCACIVLTFL